MSINVQCIQTENRLVEDSINSGFLLDVEL